VPRFVPDRAPVAFGLGAFLAVVLETAALAQTADQSQPPAAAAGPADTGSICSTVTETCGGLPLGFAAPCAAAAAAAWSLAWSTRLASEEITAA